MNEKCYPIDKAVIACSGPSLRDVDVFSLGLPVVAISTAIRYIPNPHIWIYADRLNEMHGEEGKLANQNSKILKFIPTNKVDGSSSNIVVCNYRSSNKSNYLETDLFTDNSDFIRGPHKSITFAIQVLHFIGIKTLIFAGNDLTAKSPDEKYAYSMSIKDKKKSTNYLKSLNQAETTLKEWYPYAVKRGYEWYSWKCGSIFESFVPKFNSEHFEVKQLDLYNYDYNCLQTSMKVNYISNTSNIPKIRREIKKQNNLKIEASQSVLEEKNNKLKKIMEQDEKRSSLRKRIIEEKKKRQEYKDKILKKYSISLNKENEKKTILDRREIRRIKLERSKRNMPWQK